MKETIEKQVTDYTVKTLQELLTLAIAGDRDAAGEIVARQEKQAAEIEQLKVKASKARAPRAEKTPLDMAKDNAYFRTALLVKQFGLESANMQTLTLASAFLDQGLAQGNLRQALNKVSQVIKAQAVEDTIYPDWIVQAAAEIPQLDENKKLEDTEETAKVEKIKAIVQKYTDSHSEQLPPPPEEIVIPETPVTAKKAGKK